MPLVDYQTLTDNLVRDDSGKIATADRDEAIARAVARFSQDRPAEKVEDVAAPGGNYLDLPAGWEADFSEIRAIEYPIGEVPPTIISPERYARYRTPTALKIQLLDAITAAQQVRITYTIQHQVTALADTISNANRETVCLWAAALLLDQLAVLFNATTDSTIQADVVDRKTKGAEYAARAKAFRQRYFDSLGVDPKRNVAAGVVVDLDQPDSQGQDRLLHPRRFR